MAFDLQTQLAKFLLSLYAGNVSYTGQALAGDGTSSLPAFSFTSEPTLGFWRSGAGIVTLQGALSVTGNIFTTGAAAQIYWNNKTTLASPTNGLLNVANYAGTVGSQIKVDALPTVGSGFGTSPAVIAGSTPFAGSVNVGTGGAATTGVITFGGTAFPSAPFVVCTCSAGAVPTIATATTTQVTFTTSVAWPASTILNWHCISSK